jgi:alpha-galactosidase
VEFVRDAAQGVRVVAGQERTHLTLHPGEEIRTPLVVLQFWRGGDWIDAQNTWRRWMIAHNIPRPGGIPPPPLLAASSSAFYNEMTTADEASQLHFIDRYAEEKFPLDIWWMDAGWFEHNGRWQAPKALRVDRARFPRGLRFVTDYMHARNLKSVVWFEPERVMPDNELYRDHPEWLLRNPTPGLVSKKLNLGDPAAREWLTNLISDRITTEGIDIYRQDFCILEVDAIWRLNDAADRQGITENHDISGYLAFWDELHRRHPNLIIDSCAGGGSRNELETLRRALPFWRSDYAFDPASNQTQTYGLSLWIPYHGTAPGPRQFEPYEVRSAATTSMVILAWDLRDPTLPYAKLRRLIADWRSYAGNYLGDFYPLTPCSLAPDIWVAWQYHRPEIGRGVIQAFRHAESAYTSAHVSLRGLEASARYRFTNLDQPSTTFELTGRQALESGLDLAINTSPGAVVITYEKVPRGAAAP